MAQQRCLMDQKKLCCSICSDVLKDPVTIPCGHSYCMNCIKSHWDEEDKKKIHSCPQCRQTFGPRPALVRNTMLTDLVGELKKTGLQAAPAVHCYAGPEDPSCDVCTGRKLKAIKFCLQCLVSYCEQHLQPHSESPAFEKHKLVEPSKEPREIICSHHGKVMKIFCRTDQQCICYLCSTDDHKEHNIVLASEERTWRQSELRASRRRIQQRIQDAETEVKALQQEVEAISRSADKAVKGSEKLFAQLVSLIKNKSSDVRRQIRSRQKTEVSRATDLQEKLQREIAKLRRKDAELERLSHTEDHTQFLHNYPFQSCRGESTDSPSIKVRPLPYFKDVTAEVSEVGEKLQYILSEVWAKSSLPETGVDGLLPRAEPKTRAEFLQCSCQITLDPNSANTRLLLSDGNRKATVTRKKQLYPSNPGRFTDMFQVLSRARLSRRHYWEVERSGYEVSVAVAYKELSRAGYESGFGNDDKSWALECFNHKYEFRHNGTGAIISGPRSSKIGVYLDHVAGILSFYSVSETMTLLHRVQTAFTQPLYHGLGVFGSHGCEPAAELCKHEQRDVKRQ